MVTFTEINSHLKKLIIYSFVYIIIILTMLYLVFFVFLDDISNDYLVLSFLVLITVEVNSLIQIITEIFIKKRIAKGDCFYWQGINKHFVLIFLITMIPNLIFILFSSAINNWFIPLIIIVVSVPFVKMCIFKNLTNNWMFIIMCFMLCSFWILSYSSRELNGSLSPKIQIEKIFTSHDIFREYIEKSYKGVLASCLKQDVYMTSDDTLYYYNYYYFESNYCMPVLRKIKKKNQKNEYQIIPLSNGFTLYYYEKKQEGSFKENTFMIDTNNSFMMFTTNAKIEVETFKKSLTGYASKN